MGYLGGDKICLFDQLVHQSPEVPRVYLRSLLEERFPLRVDARCESCSAVLCHDVERDFRRHWRRASLHVDRAVVVVRIQNVGFEPLVSCLSLDYASLHEKNLDAVVEIRRASRRQVFLWQLVESRPEVCHFRPALELELLSNLKRRYSSGKLICQGCCRARLTSRVWL